MANNNKVFLYRQNPNSTGAKLLARALGIKMIRPEGTKFTPSKDKVIINWGCGSEFNFDARNTTVVNQPEKVHNATHKLRFFELCRESGGVEIPRYTTRRVEAEDWLRNGSTVFARTRLQGSSGDGIVEVHGARDLEGIREGTLLVEYVKKKHEFRIHVGDGKVIDQQQKKKRRDVELEDVNWRIRNHSNGFVYTRNDVRVPKSVTEQALLAMEVVGLDFGAVDVLWNDRYKKAVVLEINTAPGLEGTTVVNYVNYFRQKFDLSCSIEDAYDVIELARRNGIELDRR